MNSSQESLSTQLNPWVRRVIQVAVYELVAVVFITAGTLIFTHKGVLSSVGFAVLNSVVAVIWNYIFNTVFEFWEARQSRKGRTLSIRIIHALGFEATLSLILIPLTAYWFGISLFAALMVDLGILVFFLVYTFIFNLIFDRMIGLPKSAL